MLTFYDYRPSQNAWKVRQLLHHLARPHRTVEVAIFAGEARTPAFLAISPAGKVPAIVLDDGHALAESSAILCFLADGTPYLPAQPFARAKVHQWLCFEQEHVEPVIGSLRYWTLTGKLARRDPALVADKRAAALRTLALLEREFAGRAFIAGDAYSIADIALFAYASRAEEAGLPLAAYPRFRAWLARVRAQPGFLATVHPYAIDPLAGGELPATDPFPARDASPAAG